MKLRGKLVILESVISLIFFVSLLISISVFSRPDESSYGDFLRKTVSLKIQSRKLIQNASSLLFQVELSQEEIDHFWDNVLEYTSTYNQVEEHRTLREYPDHFKEEIKELEEEWVNIREDVSTTQLQEDFRVYYLQRTSLESQESLRTTALRIEAIPLERRTLEENRIMGINIKLQRLINRVQRLVPQVESYHNNAQRAVQDAQRRRLRNVLIFNFVSVIISAIIVFGYRNRLLDMVNFIKTAMDSVSAGDLSARLRIRSNDEFGKLSRDFNTVIEALWAKLETVQNILEDVGKSISNEINLERAEKAILYLAKKNSSADGVALYIVKGEDSLEAKHIQDKYHPPYKVGEKDMPSQETTISEELAHEFAGIPVPLEGNILGETARKGEPTFWKNAPKNWDLDRDKSHPYFFSSLINLPLRVGNRVLGVLSLVKNQEGDYFSDLEYTNMQSFGELAAISIDNLLKYLEMLEVYELNREIDIAADIQKDLLPQQIPKLPDIGISLTSRTLRGINGDFYDSYLLSNSKLLVVICEVAGKGVPAALVIIMLKTILKLVAKPDRNSAEIITELNRNITERIKIENIATLSLLIIDSQKKEISYASAGHEPLIVFNEQQQEMQQIKPKGIPVGLDKNAEYEEEIIPMDDNHVYMQCTDGILESRDTQGKIYGTKGIRKILMKYQGESAERINTEIMDDLSFFQRDTKQWDDQTLMIMKTTGENS